MREVVILVAFCAAFALATSAHATVTNVAWYRLGENDPGAVSGGTATNTTDLLGLKHLTQYNNPSYTNAVSTSASNRVGSSLAVNFNGAGQFFSNSLVSTAINNFGIEAWVKPNGNSNFFGNAIVYNGSVFNGWGLFCAGGNYAAAYGGGQGSTFGPITNGTWAHLALVRDSGQTRLYFNGVAVFMTNTAPVAPSGGFELGHRTGAFTDEFFRGLIDEVRVFSFAPGEFSADDLLFNLARVTTLAASGVTKSNATLNGRANPALLPTIAWFEWGTTTNYGNATTAQPMGSGTAYTNFSEAISGLTQGAVYHFRAVASNSFGLAYGSDAVFATLSFVTAMTSGDINLVTGTENHPHITQNETAIWGHSNTVVVAFNDSRGVTNNPVSIGGVSVSTNGGISFTRLPYLFNETAACYGQPSVFYSRRAAKWYVSFLSARCGVQGAGQWESSDGIHWSESGCIAMNPRLESVSTWVDNNPASPYYGRQYAAFNQEGAAVRFTYSTDDGLVWSSPPITIINSFRRAISVIGSLGTDGTVFIQMLDEGGGGLNGSRTNFIARSTNGGPSWSIVQQGPAFLGPGRGVNGYFACMYTNPVPMPGYWLEMGWGSPGVGPDGVVHYAYSARTTNPPDPGNIYYTRSIDNGTTWSAPIQLNTDTTTRAQWSPALSVNVRGFVFVSWYDERNTTNDSLERFGRASFDNGAVWETDIAISDVIFPKPLQPDSSVNSAYVGFYNRAAFSDDGYGDVAYHGWTDGRVSINGVPQQDVFFDKIFFSPPLRIDSINRLGNGEIFLEGSGLPNLIQTIQGSTSLTPGSFSPLGNVTPNSSGVWQFNAGPPTLTNRFYRLAYP